MFLNVSTFLIFLFICELQPSEFDDCKFSQKGFEYKGKQAESGDGRTCLFWKNAEFLHHDSNFPEGSKSSAGNYCRNPTGELLGPWCYIQSNNGSIKQSCRIPLCRMQCRWTEPGAEYFGNLSTSIAGRPCLPWNDSSYYPALLSFGMCSENVHCSSCRNPDFSTDGPWCFVRSNEGGTAKESCDAPFCHEGKPLLIDGGNGHIFNYHLLPKNGEITVQVRLWQFENWLEERVSLLLSSVDVWMTKNEIADWGAGVVLSLGNTKSVIVGSQVYDEAESSGLLSVSEWTNLTLNWKRTIDTTLILKAFLNHQLRPSLVAEIDTANMLLQESGFQFLSVFGSPSIWSFPSDERCFVTTTSQGNKTAWLKLVWDSSEIAFNISVRISHHGTIELSSSNRDPLLQVNIFSNGKINVGIINRGKVTLLSEVQNDPFDYWKWTTLQASILGDSFVLKRWIGEQFKLVTEVSQNPSFRQVSWVTTLSSTVAHWSINCQPGDVAKAEPPDCAHSQADRFYNGTQSITYAGHHCLPWIDGRLPHSHSTEKKFKIFGGKLYSQNYCRNLDHEKSGPFCYVHSNGDPNRVQKETCAMRLCQTEECKLSGTGIEYTGQKSFTQSLRQCQAVGNTSALCRNFNKSIGGPWCYTADPLVPRDTCSIEDCSREERRLILASASTNSSAWYILPAWRRNGVTLWLKNWKPEHDQSDFVLTLADEEMKNELKIRIGGGSNDKVQLARGKPERILAEASVSHLLRLATWTELCVRFSNGSIELSMEKSENPFLTWNGEIGFDIGTLSLATAAADAWIGINVNPADCISERVWGDSRSLRAIPATRQLQPSQVSTVDIFLEGYGTAAINFFTFPEELPVLALIIRVTDSLDLTLVQELPKGENTLLYHTRIMNTNISREWVHLEVKYSEDLFILEIGNKTVLEKLFTDQVILIYWIGLSVKSGIFYWTMNCEPLEISDTVRNGGWGPWSDWQCSVSCGGGEGRRKRKCNSPVPTMTGNFCIGPEVHKGICNDFPCGDVPPYVLKKIRSDLATRAESQTAKAGQTLKIRYNSNLALDLKNFTGNSSFTWSINGFIPNDLRIIQESGNLVIYNASAKDTGVWLCSATWLVRGKMKSVVMRVVALSIAADGPTLSVRRGQPVQMLCNSDILAHLYRDLTVIWTLNDNAWMNREIADNRIAISEVWEELSGKWKCVVYQKQLHLEWTTAWIWLEVLPKPSFWTYLVEDDATAPIFGDMTEEMAKFLFFALVAIILSIPLIFLAMVGFL